MRMENGSSAALSVATYQRQPLSVAGESAGGERGNYWHTGTRLPPANWGTEIYRNSELRKP